MTIKLSFQHQYSTKATDGFSLNLNEELPSKGLTAIFGESGCGKTSLLRLIAGLEKAQQGSLSFNNLVWQSEKAFTPPHRRSIAYVFQEASLFDHLNVEQNLNFAIKRCKNSRKSSFNEIVELLEIDHLLRSNSNALSGGEKQRVAIARAILSQPELLLMDEPLSALDHRRKQEFLPYLENLKENLHLPILYVTHSVNEVIRLADYVLVMEHGRRKAVGKVKGVLQELDYELSPDSGPSTLIEAQIARSNNEWGLATLSFSGGELFVTSNQISSSSKNVRFQINAKDVSIALNNTSETSIQNRIKSTINKIQELDSSHSLVTLSAGEDKILASLTRKAVSDLGLREHQHVYAQIKSVAIVK